MFWLFEACRTSSTFQQFLLVGGDAGVGYFFYPICMDAPVDYRKMGSYLAETRDYNTVEIQTEFYSTWLDNTKAKFLLNWRPHYDLKRMIDEAFDYQRAENDPRIIWYPG